MRERQPAPEQQVEPRSERAGGSLRGRDTVQLASQMGNVAFTALARTLTGQPTEQGPTVGPGGIVEFPPDYIGPTDGAGGVGQGPTVRPDGTLEFAPEHIGPSGEEPTIGPDGTLEFPPDYIGPGGDGQGPIERPDGVVEFPPDYIGPESSGAGAAAGDAGWFD